jgi:hypothetical protein
MESGSQVPVEVEGQRRTRRSRRRGQGGSIFRRNEAWTVVYRTPEGKQKWVGGFPKKKLAQDHMTEVLGAIRANRFKEPSETLFRKFCDDWLESSRPALKPRTWITYRSALKNWITPGLGNFRLCDIRRADVVDFLFGLLKNPELSRKFVKNVHTKQAIQFVLYGQGRGIGDSFVMLFAGIETLLNLFVSEQDLEPIIAKKQWKPLFDLMVAAITEGEDFKALSDDIRTQLLGNVQSASRVFFADRFRRMCSSQKMTWPIFGLWSAAKGACIRCETVSCTVACSRPTRNGSVQYRQSLICCGLWREASCASWGGLSRTAEYRRRPCVDIIDLSDMTIAWGCRNWNTSSQNPLSRPWCEATKIVVACNSAINIAEEGGRSLSTVLKRAKEAVHRLGDAKKANGRRAIE